jgi:ribosomal protein L34E
MPQWESPKKFLGYLPSGTPNKDNVAVEILCSQCGAPMSCEMEKGCWCAELPKILRVPDGKEAGCLCRSCLAEKIATQATIRSVPS